MASSSHTTHNDYDYSCPVEEGERERDWLELGLGLGISRITTTTTCRKQEHNTEQSNTTSSFEASSLVQFEAHQQIGHSLRLELGLRIVEFDNNDGSGGVRRDKDVAPLSNYNKSSKWQDNQGQEGHDHNLDLTARSSSQSWPWHRISRTSTSSLKWKKPVSNDSHNCSTPPPPPPPPPPSSLTSTTTRLHSASLWFTLSSSFNQEGEALPQIPKAYIRVKDENVTVFMVKKYLVTKLGLSNEAEIEISCMGKKLMHSQTLKQVRDSVWLPGLVDSVNSTSIPFETSLINGSILQQLMSLQYYVPCRVLC